MGDWHRVGFGDPLTGDVERELDIDRLISLTQQLRITSVAHIVNGCLITILLWPNHGSELVIWLFLVCGFGFLGFRRWAKNHKKPRPETAPAKLHTNALIQACIAGSLWGIFSALYMPSDNVITLIMICFFIVGNAAGGAFALYPLPAAAIAFVLSLMVPPWIALLLIGGTIPTLISVMVVFFFIFLIFSIRVAYLTFVKQVQFRVELQKLRREAVRANTSKNAFLSSVSHELRTPLNAIIGFAEVLQQKLKRNETGPEMVEYTAYINSSGRNLLGLINDVLDITRFEAGEMRLSETKIDLIDVLRRASQQTAKSAGRERLQVIIPDTVTQLYILADPHKIRQVITNLLSNAVKYSDQGSEITLGLHLNASKSVEVFVKDRGIGIKPDALEDIFKPFNRAHMAITDNASGAGLGLALAKNHARLHDGDLFVESIEGQGTTVTLRLPAERIVES